MKLVPGYIGFMLGCVAGWYAYPDQFLQLRLALATVCGFAFLFITVPSMGRPLFWFVIVFALLTGTSYSRWLGDSREALGIVVIAANLVSVAEIALARRGGNPRKPGRGSRRLVIGAVAIGSVAGALGVAMLTSVPLPVTIACSAVVVAVALWPSGHISMRRT